MEKSNVLWLWKLSLHTSVTSANTMTSTASEFTSLLELCSIHCDISSQSYLLNKRLTPYQQLNLFMGAQVVTVEMIRSLLL